MLFSDSNAEELPKRYSENTKKVSCLHHKKRLSYFVKNWMTVAYENFYSSVQISSTKFKKSQSVTVFFSFFRNPDTYGESMEMR